MVPSEALYNVIVYIFGYNGLCKSLNLVITYFLGWNEKSKLDVNLAFPVWKSIYFTRYHLSMSPVARENMGGRVKEHVRMTPSDDEENITLSEWLEMQNIENIVPEQDIDSYTSVDDDLTISETPPDSEIVASVSGSINEDSESDDNEDE